MGSLILTVFGIMVVIAIIVVGICYCLVTYGSTAVVNAIVKFSVLSFFVIIAFLFALFCRFPKYILTRVFFFGKIGVFEIRSVVDDLWDEYEKKEDKNNGK